MNQKAVFFLLKKKEVSENSACEPLPSMLWGRGFNSMEKKSYFIYYLKKIKDVKPVSLQHNFLYDKKRQNHSQDQG